MQVGHPPRIPVWLPLEQRVIYFVTICVANRRRVLANETAFNAFKAAIGKLENWRILAAMLMPDHLHVIVAPIRNRNAKLGNFSGALKHWMRQELNVSWNWQPGMFRSSSACRRIASRHMAVSARESGPSWTGQRFETLAVPDRF
jgi:REP element-mobilizing transposase RayT